MLPRPGLCGSCVASSACMVHADPSHQSALSPCRPAPRPQKRQIRCHPPREMISPRCPPMFESRMDLRVSDDWNKFKKKRENWKCSVTKIQGGVFFQIRRLSSPNPSSNNRISSDGIVSIDAVALRLMAAHRHDHPLWNSMSRSF